MAGHDAVMEAAADWADRADALSPEEHRALAAWLAAAPGHARAYATMRRLIQDGALLDAAEAVEAAAPAHAPPSPRSGGAARRWRAGVATRGFSPGRRRALAAGVTAAIGVPAALYFARGGAPAAPGGEDVQRFASAVGRQDRHALPDGSTLALDASSSVATDFTATRRLLRLERGAARFDVAHDAARPFEVRTPVATMVALGTSFTVDRLTNAAELRVFEGRVRLDVAGTEAPVLSAGQWALVTPRGVQRGRFDPGGQDDWQTHWLDADAMRLEFAIDRLSRYSRKPIRLSDPHLAGKSFSGRFRLDAPDQTLALICELFGLVPVARDGAIYLEHDRTA